jgi:hypothetical protein
VHPKLRVCAGVRCAPRGEPRYSRYSPQAVLAMGSRWRVLHRRGY